MKTSEIRERSDDELERLASQLREDLFGLRVKKTTNQLENTASMGAMRKDLARVETVKRARQQALEQSKPEA